MATLTHSQPLATSATPTSQATAWRTQLTAFLEKANFYRFGWCAAVALIQGCLLTPILILALSINSGPAWHFLGGYVCFLGVLIPILSAMPVRYVLAGFGLSLFVHLSLIVWNVF
jgi:hypothetical protein